MAKIKINITIDERTKEYLDSFEHSANRSQLINELLIKSRDLPGANERLGKRNIELEKINRKLENDLIANQVEKERVISKFDALTESIKEAKRTFKEISKSYK